MSPSDPSHSDPMDITPTTTAATAPPAQTSAGSDSSSAQNNSTNTNTNANANANASANTSANSNTNANTNANANASTNSNGSSETPSANTSSSTSGPNQTIGAAAAAQQPKVVQTAFIHKLYNMLEDQSIQHLISWSSSNESFVMSPTSEFSKVLAYVGFLHAVIPARHSPLMNGAANTSNTPIFPPLYDSSISRRKRIPSHGGPVSDVFHTGSPDSALWEFKHGNGNFKRGDLVGLREIKRRASRHALIHRDSFSNHKSGASQPGTPAEQAHDNNSDVRLMNLEHSLFDMHNRLARVEENYSMMSSRCQALTESLMKCQQWMYSISHFLMAMNPDRDSPLYRDVCNMQREIERQLESVRGFEHPHESVRQPYYANVPPDPGPPLSPRQVPQDDSRRPSMVDAPKTNTIRPPVPQPQHLSASPSRYGSINAGNSSPNYNRLQIPPQQPPMPHPLSSAPSPQGPNLARRHTSADIRQHGWAPTGSSPFASGNTSSNSSAQWPPSPHRVPTSSDQHVRDVLAQYEITGSKRPNDMSRHATPPLSSEAPPSSTLNADSGWSVGGPKFPRHESSLPATRRSSMASNVHSLLNPTDTAERPEEDDPLIPEDRKRKRLQ
ncbi:Flocculation suppression protein [Rasamsonia emersonii CBS 393.64]|uniref:Flocculation suppression protein n=1 Tax=Rasamsonia emersonii (strain ATCC 16479 / CBS 393.64 / IMI 116815) TaxID=1408163 RepID=A0A0F4YWN9_RASE3|nr:Flocculation suppression protein [Rasamsonia emersonii CBS 393.64]KKA22053.1 Flocculation suppression protein [Rasamsonia emersonii CBS 393.64]